MSPISANAADIRTGCSTERHIAAIRLASFTAGPMTVKSIASQEAMLVESDELDSRRKALSSALSVLNNRERRIFEGRRLTEEPIKFKELADEFGVSRERVRQIDVSSFEKVQKAVKNRVALMEAPAPPRHISFQFSPV